MYGNITYIYANDSSHSSQENITYVKLTSILSVFSENATFISIKFIETRIIKHQELEKFAS